MIRQSNVFRWVNASNGKPIEYTNFKPGLIRKENETCAAIQVGYADNEHKRHYPGYWYYKNCSEKYANTICQTSRATS